MPGTAAVNVPAFAAALAASIACLDGPALRAADQPQWGAAWGRNLVSGETGLPDGFDPATGRNLRWSAAHGGESYATPIVAGGRVYIGGNNAEPRDPRRGGDRGVLFCFAERDGQFLWQLAVPKRTEDPYYDWPKTGWSSPVTVEGDRVYTVSNRGEVLCLDARGLNQGKPTFDGEAAMLSRPGEEGQPAAAPDGNVLWRFDLVKAAGIWPHDGAHSSILIRGDLLYLNTGTGVDNTHKVIRTPDAPSLVVIDKRNGRFVARDREGIAPRVFHCTWSSPAILQQGGKDVVVFAGGDGVLYGFEPLTTIPETAEPATLHRLWRKPFDTNAPAGDIHPFLSNRAEGPSNIYGLPVWEGGRLYVAGGGDVFWGKNEAWLRCYTLTPSSTASPEVAWSAPLDRHTMSTPAVSGGLVYVSETTRKLRCLDAANGSEVWTQTLAGEVWASPLVADGKVYIGDRAGDFWVMAAGREKRLLSRVSLHEPISGTATAANRTLYISTSAHLYAAAAEAQR